MVPETRRSFLRKLTGAAAAAGLMGVTRAAAQGEQPQVAHTGWARLVTPSPHWNIHGGQDTLLAGFIREETTLKIDPTCYPVEPANLEQLSGFPFIFTNNLAKVRSPRDLLNLREYLCRGGFIYIDGCVNNSVTPSFATFYREHLELFPHLVPGAQVRRLPADHAIFRAYFPVEEDQLLFNTHGPNPHQPGAPEALFGVFDDDRMIMLLSIEHLQCGWPQNPDRKQIAMQQIANIYVYALAQ